MMRQKQGTLMMEQKKKEKSSSHCSSHMCSATTKCEEDKMLLMMRSTGRGTRPQQNHWIEEKNHQKPYRVAFFVSFYTCSTSEEVNLGSNTINIVFSFFLSLSLYISITKNQTCCFILQLNKYSKK